MLRHGRGRAAPWASVAGFEMVWKEEVVSDPEAAEARSWGGVGLLTAGGAWACPRGVSVSHLRISVPVRLAPLIVRILSHKQDSQPLEA